MLREYGRGSGKECRIQVQTLNAMRGSLQPSTGSRGETSWEVQWGGPSPDMDEKYADETEQYAARPSGSKWNKFMDRDDCQKEGHTSTHADLLKCREQSNPGTLLTPLGNQDILQKPEDLRAEAHSCSHKMCAVSQADVAAVKMLVAKRPREPFQRDDVQQQNGPAHVSKRNRMQQLSQSLFEELGDDFEI